MFREWTKADMHHCKGSKENGPKNRERRTSNSIAHRINIQGYLDEF